MKAPAISVRNLQRKIRVNVAELQRFAAKAIRHSQQLHNQKETELRKLRKISILLISDRRIALLHRRFMHQAGATDVLTFQHGEIFISVDTAQRNAVAFGNSLSMELRLYVVHGLLHLQGFDDQTQDEARKMEAAQARLLGSCNKAEELE